MEIGDEIVDLYIYVDESGTIPKPHTSVKDNDCFVLSLIITSKPSKISRKFRKGIVDICGRFPEYQTELNEYHEIKGSHVSEKRKSIIFQHFYDKCCDTVEVGIVQLHNSKVEDKFRRFPALAFNFLVWKFLKYYFARQTICKEEVDVVHLTIDERNVATNARHDLEGYIEIENFKLDKPLFSSVKVNYVDSKNESLIQLADMVANSYWRWLRFDKLGTEPNSIKMLNPLLVDNHIFEFPKYFNV